MCACGSAGLGSTRRSGCSLVCSQCLRDPHATLCTAVKAVSRYNRQRAVRDRKDRRAPTSTAPSPFRPTNHCRMQPAQCRMQPAQCEPHAALADRNAVAACDTVATETVGALLRCGERRNPRRRRASAGCVAPSPSGHNGRRRRRPRQIERRLPLRRRCNAQ